MSHAITYSSWSAGRACIGKRAYDDEPAAIAAADQSAHHYRQKRSAWGHYECWHCGSWHIGHKGKHRWRKGVRRG